MKIDTLSIPNLKNAQNRTRNHTLIERSVFNLPEAYKNLGENRFYYLRTYGCQANERDSETIRGMVEEMGYLPVQDVEQADLIIMNTCAIRKNAEDKVFGELGQLRRLKYENPDLMFVVCGCMTQEEETVTKILKTYPHIDVVFGTHNLHRFPELLYQAFFNKERVIEVLSKEGEIYENLPVRRAQKVKAWVNIMYGCDKFCTYCIVPYTRGKERSRLKEDILSELDTLVEAGYQEITLLGQNVNAYGNDLNLGYDFAKLLEEVAQKDIPRIRFMTSHPWDFTDTMVDVMAHYENIMPFLHLPLQSGNTDILKIMGRRYTSQDYLGVYQKLRTKIPHIAFSTDIIVGFPNETEDQFQDTLKMIETIGFDNCYTFIYSARPGTPAAKMSDTVSVEEKKERLQRLNAVVEKHALLNNQALIGKVVKVLVDGPSKKNATTYSGYTETNKLVNFSSDQDYTGKIVEITVTQAKTFTLNGTVNV